MVSDVAAVLAGAARFSAALRDRDVALEAEPVARDDGSLVIARDRSGGEYVLTELGTSELPRAGVWLAGSEGERAFLAPGLVAWLELLARGFTIADLAAERSAPSGRAMPGVLRWVATLR